MKSIQNFLAITIISSIVISESISFIMTHFESHRRLNILFDSHLVDEALLVHQLIDTHSNTDGSQKQDLPFQQKKLTLQNHLRVQVIKSGDANTEDQVIFNSYNSFPIQKKAGFYSFDFDGFEWRSYGSYNVENRTWVIISDRIIDRTETIDDLIATRYISSALLRICIVLLIIYLLIKFSFKPIRHLAQALSLKKANDLSPLQLTAPPKELSVLVDSVNDLLLRLDSAFKREIQFSADAAHELRNPLASIRINMDNLLEAQQTPSIDAQRLDKGIQRMQHIIVQMLALHRIAPDTSVVRFDTIDISESIRHVVTEVYDEIYQKQHNIVVDSLENTFIRAEPHAIEVLIRNLILNAVRYSPTGSDICISTEVTEGKNTQLIVMDSGPGIPVSERHKIFTRFYREAGDRHSSGVSGCGLGLSIVEKIVKLHGARIAIEDSKFKTGVSFVVTFTNNDVKA